MHIKREFTICIQGCKILVWDKSSPKPSQRTLNCFHKNLISMILGTSYIVRITLALIYKPITKQNKKRGCYKGKGISIIFFCFWVRHTATVQLTTHSSKAFLSKTDRKMVLPKALPRSFQDREKNKKTKQTMSQGTEKMWMDIEAELTRQKNKSFISISVCVSVCVCHFYFFLFFFSHCHISNHKISPDRYWATGVKVCVVVSILKLIGTAWMFKEK